MYKTVGEPEAFLTVNTTRQTRIRFVHLLCLQGHYNSFIDLQDQLHGNLCRQRTLVAIGTCDLDTIEGPFTHDARTPDDRSFSAKELLEFYETQAAGKHLKLHVPIIKDSPLYPVSGLKNVSCRYHSSSTEAIR